MSEFGLIARLAPMLDGAGAEVVVGHGDDAAVVRLDGQVVVAVDVIVEGVHFRRDLSSWQDVGWKAIAVNVSDLAAMGARSAGAVVGLCRPPSLAEEEVLGLYEGMREACDHWKLRLLGGDTVSGPGLIVSVTVLGTAGEEPIVTRSGARPGDRLVIVGALGAAAAALAQVEAGRRPDPALLAAHRRPRALPAAGRVLAERGARAMIDVSDGLGADLAHLCSSSRVGVRVRADALPVAPGALETGGWELVCGGGEDFALVAAVPPDLAATAAREAGAAEGVSAAVVGEVTERAEGHAVVLELPNGGTLGLDEMGYDHFSGEKAR